MSSMFTYFCATLLRAATGGQTSGFEKSQRRAWSCIWFSPLTSSFFSGAEPIICNSRISLGTSTSMRLLLNGSFDQHWPISLHYVFMASLVRLKITFRFCHQCCHHCPWLARIHLSCIESQSCLCSFEEECTLLSHIQSS